MGWELWIRDGACFLRTPLDFASELLAVRKKHAWFTEDPYARRNDCLLYTSDAADERSSVDLGGRRILKKKK